MGKEKNNSKPLTSLPPLFTMSTPVQLPADIVSCIIEQVTIAEPSLSKIVQLSHINTVFADSCRSIVTARVRSVIRAFMDDIVMDSLFEVLESVRGLIAGSAALAVIEPGFFIDHPPRGIDIMTPYGTMTEWIAWCDNQNFGDRESEEVELDQQDSTKSILQVRMHNVSNEVISQYQRYLPMIRERNLKSTKVEAHLHCRHCCLPI